MAKVFWESCTTLWLGSVKWWRVFKEKKIVFHLTLWMTHHPINWKAFFTTNATWKKCKKIFKIVSCLTMNEGVNYIVTLVPVPVKDLLWGVEKVMGSWPGTLLWMSNRKLSWSWKVSVSPRTAWLMWKRSLLSPWNVAHTILPSDKSNIVLSTAEYN